MASKTSTTIREYLDKGLIDLYADEISSIPHLSAEEEGVVCKEIASGRQSALEKLVVSHLPLVLAEAKRNMVSGASLSDLVEEGNIALISAAMKFDPSRGKRFAQYAIHDVRRAIVAAIPPAIPKMKRTAESLPAEHFDIDNESSEKMEKKLAMLPEREQKVLRSLFGIGTESLTMKETGDLYGLKRERVRQIRDKALRQLHRLRNL